MSREIKFRGKRIDNGDWVYGQYFITPLTDENSGTTPDAGWFFLTGETRHCIVQNRVAFVIEPNTLGQYTGLKDKNGKEIYEGDIVTLPVEPNADLMQAIIEWEFDGWKFKWLKSRVSDIRGKTIEPVFHNIRFFEIIGNIHENKELLA